VHLAGAQVRYDPRAPVGRRVRSVTVAGGRRLQAKGEYTLATDEATAGGAGGMTPLAGLVFEREGLLDVEADAMYLRRLPQPVEASQPAGFVSTRK
jgi:hypothetical protein